MYNLQCTIYNLQFTIYNLQFTTIELIDKDSWVAPITNDQ